MFHTKTTHHLCFRQAQPKLVATIPTRVICFKVHTINKYTNQFTHVQEIYIYMFIYICCEVGKVPELPFSSFKFFAVLFLVILVFLFLIPISCLSVLALTIWLPIVILLHILIIFVPVILWILWLIFIFRVAIYTPP